MTFERLGLNVWIQEWIATWSKSYMSHWVFSNSHETLWRHCLRQSYILQLGPSVWFWLWADNRNENPAMQVASMGQISEDLWYSWQVSNIKMLISKKIIWDDKQLISRLPHRRLSTAEWKLIFTLLSLVFFLYLNIVCWPHNLKYVPL